MKNIAHIAFLILPAIVASAQDSPVTLKKQKGAVVIYSADFTKPLQESDWVTEAEAHDSPVAYTSKGKLILDSPGGITFWLNRRLNGNILIEYERTVAVQGKINDRLSDLNQFWMASDPRNPKLFTRVGAFSEYDSLRLYYVGMGGNANSTTRFRKYDGSGDKKLIGEYTDADHLLRPNRTYHISIVVKDGQTSFWVDNQCYFIFHDPDLLREGYFGFRSVHSRQLIGDFKIFLLQ